MDESVLLMRQIRQNNRLLLTLVIAWSMLLGAAHAVHAVYHLTLPGNASTAADHTCTLCSLERDAPLVTPGQTATLPVPEPALLPILAPTTTGAATSVHPSHALSPC